MKSHCCCTMTNELHGPTFSNSVAIEQKSKLHTQTNTSRPSQLTHLSPRPKSPFVGLIVAQTYPNAICLLSGAKLLVGNPGEVEWGCDRSGSARVGHAGGAAQSWQFVINNNVGKHQRVWGITTGARRAQRRSNGATPEKRTADRWRKSRPMVRGVDTQRRPI